MCMFIGRSINSRLKVPLQTLLNLRLVTAVLLSVLFNFGVPFRFRYCFKSLTAVMPSGVLQNAAAGHLLYQSMDGKIKIGGSVLLLGR